MIIANVSAGHRTKEAQKLDCSKWIQRVAGWPESSVKVYTDELLYGEDQSM